MIRRLVGVLLPLLIVGCGGSADDQTPGGRKEQVPPAATRSAATARPLHRAPLPGAPAFPEVLQRRIDTNLAARSPYYRPRTRHLTTSGAPVYTNRLIFESSPYLLQHAHNPVNWFPWGEEAFETARRLGRPVILSVGYSTCHWCHVMEEESFEDEEIARYLNENYVLIKVDWEERPDINGIYMLAVQKLTGRGGWPMTVWLTPDRKPFFGGTYFPARDGDRGVRTGFLTLAKRLREAYANQGDAVAAQAAQLEKAIQEAVTSPPAERRPGPEVMRTAAEGFASRYDPVNGGFRHAPKFPEPTTLEFLLRYQRRTGEKKFLQMVEQTLSRMAAGGIHDQIGGGFHRYSTDTRWLVPHFEKMLYDNAQIAWVCLDAYQATGNDAFAGVARDILAYAAREMQSPEGGFYSATDADSDGVEGKFYVWTPDEIEQVLGAKRGKLVRAYYGVTPEGNFEGANILHVETDLSKVARAAGIPVASARGELDASRRALYEARRRRIAPHTDTKVIASWNGLMLSAYARAALVLREPRDAVQARRTADFLLSRLARDGRVRRIWKDGEAKVEGTLEDYAFVTQGLLDVFEATSDPKYLTEAKRLAAALEARFVDRKGGGYFLTPDDGERLLAREKSDVDAATPSGNSVAAMNLLRLAEITSDDAYRKRSDRVIRGASGVLARSPTAAASMLSVLDFRSDLPKEIAIVTPASGRASPFLDRLARVFLPNRILVVVSSAEAAKLEERVPLLRGKRPIGNLATAYVCEQRVCALPTTDVLVFAGQIARVRKLSEVSRD